MFLNMCGMFLGVIALSTIYFTSFLTIRPELSKTHCCKAFTSTNNCSICCPTFFKALCIDDSKFGYCYCEEDELSTKMSDLANRVAKLQLGSLERDNVLKDLKDINEGLLKDINVTRGNLTACQLLILKSVK